MKNIVFITIDCLRFDAVSKDYTPFLWSLKREGLFFARAYSLGSWTTPSLAGLLTSTYPLMYDGDLRIKYPRVSVAEALQKAGYTTVGLTFHPYLNAIYGFNKGFDMYYDSVDGYRQYNKTKKAIGIQKIVKRSMKTLARIIRGIPRVNRAIREVYYYRQFKHLYRNLLLNNVSFRLEGDKINEIARQTISNLDMPFFLWIHYLDTHFPYMPKTQDISREKIALLNVEREKWHKLKKTPYPETLEELKKIYLLTANDVDNYVRNIIEYFMELGLYEDTIFIVSADHGEEFYEHNGFHHEIKLYEELIHVPLFIFGGKIKSKEIKRPVSHIDVFPTIFDILGLKKPKEWVGDNMLLKRRGFVFSEEGQKYPGDAFKGSKLQLDLKNASIAVVSDKWKYINYTEREEFYNLISDPNEQDNLVHKGEWINTLEDFRFHFKEHLAFVNSYKFPEKIVISKLGRRL